jgi:hypothetical protein
VIANPRGYARSQMIAGASRDMNWENPAFDPVLVIDV